MQPSHRTSQAYKMPIDEKIWNFLLNEKTNQEEWAEIAEHLVRTLGEYLSQSIEQTDMIIVDGQAIRCSIRSAGTFGGELLLAWEGILGFDVMVGRPYVSASL